MFLLPIGHNLLIQICGLTAEELYEMGILLIIGALVVVWRLKVSVDDRKHVACLFSCYILGGKAGLEVFQFFRKGQFEVIRHHFSLCIA